MIHPPPHLTHPPFDWPMFKWFLFAWACVVVLAFLQWDREHS
jgi:hypothetical protein